MIRILMIGIMIITLSGCTNNNEQLENEVTDDPTIAEVIVNDEDPIEKQNDLKTNDVAENEENFITFEDEHVYIRPHYSEPDALKDPNTIVWESSVSGEFIEIVVKGKIINFEIVSLGFDEKSNLIENDILFKSPI